MFWFFEFAFCISFYFMCMFVGFYCQNYVHLSPMDTTSMDMIEESEESDIKKIETSTNSSLQKLKKD